MNGRMTKTTTNSRMTTTGHAATLPPPSLPPPVEVVLEGKGHLGEPPLEGPRLIKSNASTDPVLGAARSTAGARTVLRCFG